MNDSDRNIMTSLAGETDEPCHFCLEPVRMSCYGGLYNINWYWECTVDEDGELPCHQDCFDAAKEKWLEDKAEARREMRLH